MNQPSAPVARSDTSWLIWLLWIILWLEVSYISGICLLLLFIGLFFDDDGTPFAKIVMTFGVGAALPVVIGLLGMHLENLFYRRNQPVWRYATLLFFILGLWAAVRLLRLPFMPF